jgi:hypothetical protein
VVLPPMVANRSIPIHCAVWTKPLIESTTSVDEEYNGCHEDISTRDDLIRDYSIFRVEIQSAGPETKYSKIVLVHKARRRAVRSRLTHCSWLLGFSRSERLISFACDNFFWALKSHTTARSSNHSITGVFPSSPVQKSNRPMFRRRLNGRSVFHRLTVSIQYTRGANDKKAQNPYLLRCATHLVLEMLSPSVGSGVAPFHDLFVTGVKF